MQNSKLVRANHVLLGADIALTFRFYLEKRFIFPLPASRKEHNTQSSYNESLSIHLQEEIMAAHILVGHVVLAPKKVNRIVFNLYAFTVVLLH